MARLVVMYGTPIDADAFDRHYTETHIPLTKIPGLRKFEVSRGPVVNPMGPSTRHLVATLHFDDMASLQTALACPEGEAAKADVQVFATGGVDILVFATDEI